MEVAAAMALAMIEPLSSHMTSPVESVLTPGHMVSKMQYQTDPAHLGRQITQILLTSPDPETVLPKIAGVLGEVFQVDACSIVAGSDRAAPQTVCWCAASGSVMPLQRSEHLFDRGALLAVLADSSPLAIPDIQVSSSGQQVGWRWDDLPVRGVLGVQTRFQLSANGALVLVRKEPGDWTDREKELLVAVSNEVAIAISQVQLQRQVRTAAQYQTLIDQLSPVLRNAWEMEQILQVATQETARSLQVDSGLILLLKYTNPQFGKRKAEVAKRRQKQSVYSSSNAIAGSALLKNVEQGIPKAKATVVCEWQNSTTPDLGWGDGLEQKINKNSSSRSSSAQHSLNRSFWLSECPLCQKAFTNAPEPMAIADRREVPLLESKSGIAQLSDQNAMPAILMVPLESQGTVLGFLILQHSQPRFWQLEELDLVKWVSAQASTVIIQAQTLRQVQALVEERTGQLQGSLEVQAKLYEKTRQQIDQLRQLNQLKDEFVSTISHELRTPLTTMSVAIELLLRKPELPAELRVKYLDILKQQCTHEINLINDLLTLQELESHKQPIQVQNVDLKQLILDLAAAFEQQWADKGLTLAVDLPKRSVGGKGAAANGNFPDLGEGKASGRSLMLQTDPDSLKRILLELLTNAGKYSDPDTTVTLRVTQQGDREVNHIVLSISNFGSGISPAEKTYIFDKFRRGQGVTQQAVQGTGLGLALVKSLVQHLNGTIDVASCPTDNTQSCETCFTITLPQFFDSTKV